MNINEYLKQLEKDDLRIQAIKRKIERLENRAYNLSSKPMDSDRVQKTSNKDRIADLTVQIMTEKERLERLQDDNEYRIDTLTEHILSIDDPDQSKVLYYQLIEQKNCVEIADTMDKAPKTIHNISTNARKSLAKLFVGNE